MKGNAKLIESLNSLLVEELTAINQYMVHAEMCANWMYERLHKAVEKRAIDEMKHAEKLIARIIFLEGMPIVSRLNEIHIGSEVASQIASDYTSELDAVRHYNEVIRQAVDVGDNKTRELLEEILEDEDKHVDWLEAQQDQIKQTGIQIYLGEQIA